MSKQEVNIVGVGEVRVAKSASGVLACLGLGSCIAVCAYDPVSRVGGMTHIVLPSSMGKNGPGLEKYADKAVPLLLKRMEQKGAVRRRLNVKLVGGARLSRAPGFGDTFQTGDRNRKETEKALAAEGIPISAAATGGEVGRTVRMFLDTGKVVVRTGGNESREL